ncbi:hypothetical protein O6H91_01G166800 [Diphasiastrum complanatum]|nr:hypothetical protein O6H91_01G166800 [Diphasiastrum complanatum]
MALRVHPAIRGSVTMFSAYGDFNHFPRKVREGCQRTGVNLIDVPNGKKDASDKAILVDMFLFALDNPPPCTIFLISGDVDFASALHKLGQRGYTIVLAIPSGVGVASTLCSAGRYVWDWPSVARGEGLVPAKAFQSREFLYAGNEINSYFIRQGSGGLASDDSDQSKDEFSESSQRSILKNKGHPSLWNHDFIFNRTEAEQYRNLKSVVTIDESNFQCAIPSSTSVNPLDPSTRVLPTNFLFPQNCQRVDGAAQLRSFEKSHIVDGAIVGDQHEEPNEGIEPTSPGANSQTSWVQPGDLEGLKRQLVKLLSLHGGKLGLLRLPAEYCKIFGRPLYLAEYKSLKLAHLVERMRDTFLVKGEGTARTLHLTKAGMRFANKYKKVWGSCISRRDRKANAGKEEVSFNDSPQKGCRHAGSSCTYPKEPENREISGSSPDSDSTSADEKGVDQEEREEDAADFEIPLPSVLVEEHEAGVRLEAFKQDLQELLVSHACKILVSSFLALYQLRYARHLDYTALGFQTLESLFEKVQDVAVLEEAEGSGRKFLVAKCAAQNGLNLAQNVIMKPPAASESSLQGESRRNQMTV